MHTPSTRILSALAYDFGREYDPSRPGLPGARRRRDAERARDAHRRRRRPVRAGAPAPARARPRAGGDPGLVLRRGPDRRAVGDDGLAVRLIDRHERLGRAARRPSRRPGRRASHVHDHNLQGGHMSTTTSTILVAEEHDATRAFLADNLIADGYRVLIAPDRGEGDRAAEHGAPGPDPRRRQRADARAGRRDPLRRGARRPGRSGHAADRAEPRRGSAAADPGARARRRRRRAQAVRLPGAARPDRRGAAALGAAAHGADPARRSDRDRRPLARGPVSDRPVELSAKEYDLLVTLAGEPTRVFTRAELMRGDLGHVRRSGTRGRSTATPPAASEAVRRWRGPARDQRSGASATATDG